MATDSERQQDLLEREAAFWDRQEEAIDSLYERPHDWRFTPEIANRMIRPKINFIRDVYTRYRSELNSCLDIGCGNGWFCHAAAEVGMRAYGVDVSSKKIDAATRLAKEKGVSDLCTFYADDVMAVDLPEKVDLMTAQGSLHHFPDLKNILPKMVEKFLRPGGLMLFVEPNFEGMPPAVERKLMRIANMPLIGRLFDKEFYQEVSGGVADHQPGHDEGAKRTTTTDPDDFNIRGESPAGLEFFGEEPDMRDILTRNYDLIEEKYFMYFLGHGSNAFYVYMKSGIVKTLYKLTLPLWIWLDDRKCGKKQYQVYAEEGAWLMRGPQ